MDTAMEKLFKEFNLMHEVLCIAKSRIGSPNGTWCSVSVTTSLTKILRTKMEIEGGGDISQELARGILRFESKIGFPKMIYEEILSLVNVGNKIKENVEWYSAEKISNADVVELLKCFHKAFDALVALIRYWGSTDCSENGVELSPEYDGDMLEEKFIVYSLGASKKIEDWMISQPAKEKSAEQLSVLQKDFSRMQKNSEIER